MIFRQLYEPDSSTYTYLVACPDSGDAVLIDPVLDAVTRDLSVVQQLGLNLRVTLDTHVHADHLTGARRLKQLITLGFRCRRGVARPVRFWDAWAPHPAHPPGLCIATG
jgi:glyoxylase-like metal-dependent hydrolase (beta-lactamase superfamily II)